MNSSFLSIQNDAPNIAFCLFYGSTVLFQIFWPSYFGNEIEVTSDSTLNAIYASDWISADAKLKKLCLIAMENVKKPIKLRALRIFDVNLESFLFVRRRERFKVFSQLKKIHFRSSSQLTP